MSERERIQTESSGWGHRVPVQDSERKTIWGAVWVFVALGIVILCIDAGAGLVILGFVAGLGLILPPIFRATQPKVNICPTCNVRTTYNPYQKVCGRCGHRP